MSPLYLLSAGLDGPGGSRTWSHFTLLCLSPKLQKIQSRAGYHLIISNLTLTKDLHSRKTRTVWFGSPLQAISHIMNRDGQQLAS